MAALFSDNITPVPQDGQYHADPLDPMTSYRVLAPPSNPQGVAQIIAFGNTAALGLRDDGETVLKFAWDEDFDALEIEGRILRTLGEHERLVKYIGSTSAGHILRYEPHGSIKCYYSAHDATTISTECKIQWSRQIAEAIAYIHSRQVIHADIHPNNVLIDRQLNARLCDFSGSLYGELDGKAMESVRFWLPRDVLLKPTIRSDLFALGSLLFWIFTGRQPYEELEDGAVSDLFARGQFPDLDTIPASHIIKGCWDGSLKEASDVVQALFHIDGFQS